MNRVIRENPDGTWSVEGIVLTNLHPVVYAALEKLREYEDTDLSPDEIHIMSEELAAYHELMITPEELRKIRKKIVTKPIEVYKGVYLCPECGWIVGFVGDEKSKGIQKHCERCGQALVKDKGKYEIKLKIES